MATLNTCRHHLLMDISVTQPTIYRFNNSSHWQLVHAHVMQHGLVARSSHRVTPFYSSAVVSACSMGVAACRVVSKHTSRM